MIVNVVNKFGPVFYKYFRKHNCPKCGTRMKIIRVSATYDASSTEGREYAPIEGGIKGEVKVYWDELMCPVCHEQTTFEALRNLKETDIICNSGVGLVT